MTNPLLEVKNLRTHFHTERGRVTAVDDVSFSIAPGEIVGVVGESGCGKSVTSQSIMRLFDEKRLVEYEGDILFNNESILHMPQKRMQKIRGNDMSMIFQDPISSLNPVYTVGDQIAETIRLHQKVTKKQAHQKAVEMLRLTGIPAPEKRVNEFPHQLSGGMQQRVMIAMALSCQPSLLIADEPTTALDVTIQAQILDLIRDLNKDMGMAVMFITHDLGVVSELCSKVIVMYLGEIVEITDTESLFTNPLHPYTKGLIQSIPQLDGDRKDSLPVIEGTVPSLDQVPNACRFSTRCPFADELCKQEHPVLEHDRDEKHVRCWHYKKIG
ncbi:ABC transporter ATP-binding protein [Saliterribacillus persicus]|uniref:Peptide/nickel transport system ATP-binding protein n=1 Tax=Saliterribacillus persicus TaxID=930114 RepID=A0A368YBP9_9BACI|nr:ABC transporter ATP-binding protein [Saliterribacillus persicus]RCW76858.1 peptide/nickel transport system ATP-binding protein [Saliterribacillus persicus]